MSATDLLIWGIVVHLLVDWLGQNEWIAVNKASRLVAVLRDPHEERTYWWLRHPAAYIHAGMQGAAQLLVFPWWGALAIGVTHLLIDTRVPVAWWSKLIKQTQPQQQYAKGWAPGDPRSQPSIGVTIPPTVMDIGADVRIWADQVWHISVIAALALVAA